MKGHDTAEANIRGTLFLVFLISNFRRFMKLNLELLRLRWLKFNSKVLV